MVLSLNKLMSSRQNFSFGCNFIICFHGALSDFISCRESRFFHEISVTQKTQKIVAISNTFSHVEIKKNHTFASKNPAFVSWKTKRWFFGKNFCVSGREKEKKWPKIKSKYSEYFRDLAQLFLSCLEAAADDWLTVAIKSFPPIAILITNPTRQICKTVTNLILI